MAEFWNFIKKNQHIILGLLFASIISLFLLTLLIAVPTTVALIWPLAFANLLGDILFSTFLIIASPWLLAASLGHLGTITTILLLPSLALSYCFLSIISLIPPIALGIQSIFLAVGITSFAAQMAISTAALMTIPALLASSIMFVPDFIISMTIFDKFRSKETPAPEEIAPRTNSSFILEKLGGPLETTPGHSSYSQTNHNAKNVHLFKEATHESTEEFPESVGWAAVKSSI